jgi:hypothetical protein
MRNLVNLCLLCLLSYGSCFFVSGGFEIIEEGEATKRWPMVTGKVLKTYIRKASGRSTRHVGYVRYTYEVAGKHYKTSRGRYRAVLFSDKSHESVETFLGRYVSGAPVNVFYNPLKPEESVLIAGPSMEGPVLIFFGSIMGLMSLPSWVSLLRKRLPSLRQMSGTGQAVILPRSPSKHLYRDEPK